MEIERMIKGVICDFFSIIAIRKLKIMPVVLGKRKRECYLVLENIVKVGV
jgi:hypothetical protein